LFVHTYFGVSLKNKNDVKLPHSQTFLQIMVHIRQPMEPKNRLHTPTIDASTTLLQHTHW